MTDDAEKFFEMRDGFDREAQSFAAAAAQPMPSTAADPNGAITVALDADGGPTVTLSERWRDDYEPGTLGAEIVRTFQTLVAERTAGWAQNLDASFDQERRTRPLPSVDDTLAGRLQDALDGDEDSATAVTGVLENILALLDDVSANIDQTFDAAFQRGRTVERSAPPSRNLVVELTVGGDLVGISFSESWLQRTSAAQVSRELNAAIAEARERSSGTRAAGPLDGTPLAAYQRFIDDQDALVAYLRGKE